MAGRHRQKGLHRPRLSAIILSSRPPALIQIAAPFSSRLSRYRKASLSSRMLSALIFASLNDAGENEGTHNLVLTALLAIARALVGLHLCGAAARHADRRTHAVEHRGH